MMEVHGNTTGSMGMHSLHGSSTDGLDLPNFFGHTIPGTIFLLFGLRWMYCPLYRHFLCQKEAQSGRKNVRRYESSLLYTSALYPSVPLEPIIGVIGSFLGFIVELFHYNPTGYALHNLLYISFGLTSMVDLVIKCGLPLPKHIEYFSGIIAGWANAMLLYTHSKHHGPLDNEIHLRLLVVIIIVVFTLILEVLCYRKVMISVARGYITCYMGCWYITIAHILYPVFHNKPLDDNHGSLMILEIIFVIEMLVLSVIMIIVATIAHLKVKYMTHAQVSTSLSDEYFFIKKHNSYRRSDTVTTFCDDSKEPLLYSDIDSDSRCI